MGSLSIVHWMLLAGLMVLMFGKGKISAVMADAAQGIKAFKRGMQDDAPPEKPDPAKADAVATVAPLPSPVAVAPLAHAELPVDAH